MANKDLINSIVEAITTQIHQGKSYVTESDLSVTLKVSRTRLRESIQTLHTYGIISKRQKCGITLAQPDCQNLCESFILRETLGKLITDSVLKNITDSDCKKLEDIDRRLQDAHAKGNYPAVLRHDLEFHHAFTDIGEMKIASQILRNLHFLNYAYLAPLVTKLDDHSVSQLSHQEIVDSLRRRDPACHKLVRQHIQQGRKLLMKYYPTPDNGPIQETII
jgi:DNA-binding GntR family transcriptional regulator